LTQSDLSHLGYPRNDVVLEDSDQQKNKPVIFACIPAFNEEASIGKIILQTQKYVNLVIVCDDGSADYTAELSEALGAYVIRHELNGGKGAALRDLFKFAMTMKPDIVVVLDADGQHNPSFIPSLVEPILTKEADMVIGSRFVKGGKSDAPPYRRFGLFILNKNPGKVKDAQSGLRAFSGEALEVVSKAKASDFGVELEQIVLAQQHGLILKEIPVEIRYKGIHKTSKIHPFKQGTQILMMMLRLTTEKHPIIFLGIPASIIFSIGILSGLLLLLDYLNEYFNQFYALVFLTCVSLGLLIGISTLILYAISRIKNKL